MLPAASDLQPARRRTKRTKCSTRSRLRRPGRQTLLARRKYVRSNSARLGSLSVAHGQIQLRIGLNPVLPNGLANDLGHWDASAEGRLAKPFVEFLGEADRDACGLVIGASLQRHGIMISRLRVDITIS